MEAQILYYYQIDEIPPNTAKNQANIEHFN